MQVQRTKAKCIMKKLLYITRGTCRILKYLKNTLYDLILDNGKPTAVINNHGNEAFLSPHHIKTHQHL